jgi:predicted amidohydrolase
VPEVRVAAAQIWVDRDPAQNLAKCLDRVETACRAGAQLVLLPEFSNYSGPIESQEQAWELASALDGPFVQALAARAREHQAHVAFNIMARGRRPEVFDTTVLLGPDGGTIGTYEKQVLFGYETDFITPGRGGQAVFDTALGRLGLYICMDGVIPETTRCLALQGAQVLLNPLHSGGPDEAALHVPIRAAENHVWVVSSNLVGPRPSGAQARWAGGSSIVSPTGETLARGSEHDEEIVYGTIRPEAADDKRLAEGADLLADRRPETYGRLAVHPLPVPTGQRAAPARVQAAAIQVGPTGDGVEATVERALALSQAAAAADARLLVLPELFPFAPGEIAADPSTAARRSTAALARFERLARAADLHVVLSLVEAAGSGFYHTVFMVGPRGVAGRYRQTHRWPDDRVWAAAGEDYPVFATPLGRIGLMVGYDGLFPEVPRLLTLGGAEIIAYPTTWRVAWEPRLAVLERAAENHVHLVAAARPDAPVRRGSMLVPVDRYPTDPHWWVRSPQASEIAPGNDQFLTVGLCTSYANDKTIFYNTDLIAHRRPTLYGSLVEPARTLASAGSRTA